MYLVKIKNGSYVPAYNGDKEKSDKIKVGDEVYATQARNAAFHRKGMALFQLGYQNQDKIEDFNVYRYITTMKAGFVIYQLGKDGKQHPFPESLSFEKMSEARFQEVYKAVRLIISKEAKISGISIDAEIENFF